MWIPDLFIEEHPRGFWTSCCPRQFYMYSYLHRVKLDILWISDASTKYLNAEMIYIEQTFARSFLKVEANYINSSFLKGVCLYRFNRTQLPKTKKMSKITKLMSFMNFWIMIQAMINSFGRSSGKRIENSSEVFCFYLYSIVNKCFKHD